MYIFVKRGESPQAARDAQFYLAICVFYETQIFLSFIQIYWEIPMSKSICSLIYFNTTGPFILSFDKIMEKTFFLVFDKNCSWQHPF